MGGDEQMKETKNLEINIDVIVREEHKWELGSSKTKILLPINHISSMLFDNLIQDLIKQAHYDYIQRIKEKENEDTEGDTPSTDEE